MNTYQLDSVDPGTAFSVAGLLYLLMAIAAGMHVVLNKQNEASAFSWLGIIILAPLVGALLYWLFGINRIRRRAQAELPDHTVSATPSTSRYGVNIGVMPSQWQSLMKLGMGVHHAPYLSDNRLQPLLNGDEAYPEMLKAITEAQISVVLSSYIFEHDEVGLKFVDALVSAHKRGVQVRVLIDGIGVGYGLSLVRSDRVLRRYGVKTARFLSTLSTTGTRFINLRNHRKILSVDGKVAFVGGMNIRQGNVLKTSVRKGKLLPGSELASDVLKGKLLKGSIAKQNKHLTQDVHFKVEGPVINQVNAVFTADWLFAAREKLTLPLWSGSQTLSAVTCRVLLDGPDDNYKKLELTMLGAIQAAQLRVCIVTPYFLPGASVLSALHLAALRGVQVDVCLPKRNNLPFVGWAMRANHRQLISQGINIYESAPPFDHSKLFLVDNYWSMIGSSNWDARSLELNFEINLECYDSEMNKNMARIMEQKLTTAQRVVPSEQEHILRRLRNNFFRLFSPYL